MKGLRMTMKGLRMTMEEPWMTFGGGISPSPALS
jgi:hypothetical protein